MPNKMGSVASLAVSGTAFLLGILLVSQAYLATPRMSPLSRGGSGALLPQRAGDAANAETLNAEQFASILERPLFSRSRRPFVPPPLEVVATTSPEVQTEPPLNEPQLTLQGIFIHGNIRRALIRTATEPFARWQNVGEVVSGWSIAEIETNGIMLEARGETRAVNLYVDNSP